MMPPEFADPPTKDSLANARRSLNTNRVSVRDLTNKIDAAEAELAQYVLQAKFTIGEMQKEKKALEEKLSKTLAYLSPIRRLPLELLREIFLWCFEDHPCSAWVLASVCVSWRRLSLRIPVIWSKIRLLTTQHASADTIRLWLERSGDSVPLDIEVFLRIGRARPMTESPSSRGTRSASISGSSTWNLTPALHPPTSHVIVHPPHPPPPLGNAQTVTSSSVASHNDTWGPDRSANAVSRVSMHWGHIAFFYLVEQMHRWERFVFRFDKQFTSMGALKSITGDAPLLREFEVSSIEAGFFAEWPWLPNASSSGTTGSLPNLRTLTLQHTPFKWSSPMLRNLHSLNLRALPTSHLPLDRILTILSNNPQLNSVSLHFQGVLPAVLPLATVTLPDLISLSLGGHFLLTNLVDQLVLPSLRNLTLDIEARDPIEDVICSLLHRSNNPPVSHLAIGYSTPPHLHHHPHHHNGGPASSAAAFYYGASAGMMVIGWPTLLAELEDLKTLWVGSMALEPLLSALGPPDDDALTGLNPPVTQFLAGTGSNPNVGGSAAAAAAAVNGWTWACPNLENLGLKGCHTHNDGVNKLVQMIEARNPDTLTSVGGNGGVLTGSGGGTPEKLKKLELYDCTSLGEDVMHWLEARIDEVVCSEPISDRTPMAHPYL
ncbi:hypothetical protein CPB83DRAFT_549151 [Crepidotus variabilis]|uniref:F-box domain-containing protein n=1 Tax=Crepidotus variabilis TaxID=179855 RepID=A0A9P6E9V5_9AGAR|nr:hypothetical protein CPB83DRAFT_549151 [Crepidotus variabilis]